MAAKEITRKKIQENKRNVFFTGCLDILSEMISIFYTPCRESLIVLDNKHNRHNNILSQ